MRKKAVTLQLNHGRLKFSAGHFTIFSATQREPLHGHNYFLEVTLTATLNETDITFDYHLFEDKLIGICRQLHLRCLIPTKSPYLQVIDDGSHYHLTFDQQSMWLLKTDVVLLSVGNISLEALSQWFIDQLKKESAFLSRHHIQDIVIMVFNGSSHGAKASL